MFEEHKKNINECVDRNGGHTVLVYDDKKEKYQSLEAHLYFTDEGGYVDSYEQPGYGVDETEAVEQLLENIDTDINRLTAFKTFVQDYKNSEVIRI